MVMQASAVRSMDPRDLAGLVGKWPVGEGPLFRQLADALARLIRIGEIDPDTRLPPERALARHLVVGRSTVVQAYELLKREGLLTSRQGSGTWVCSPPPLGGAVAARDRPLPSPAGSMLFSGLSDGLAAPIDFSIAALPAAPAMWSAYRDVTACELEALGRGHGYMPAGHPELRAA